MQRVTREQLRAHLDEYLTAAEGGETIEVCDHERNVVRLVPGEDDADLSVGEVFRAVQDEMSKLPPADIDVVAWLREDRDQR